jgi:hypothetical protein
LEWTRIREKNVTQSSLVRVSVSFATVSTPTILLFQRPNKYVIRDFLLRTTATYTFWHFIKEGNLYVFFMFQYVANSTTYMAPLLFNKLIHYMLIYTAKTKCRKFETNIPRKGIFGPHSQFPHSCICERIIYSHDGSAFSAGGNMWTNPGKI